MQTTTTLLSIIRKRGQRGLPLCNVYRMLYNKNLYLTAYGKLYRNAGAMTQGATKETVIASSIYCAMSGIAGHQSGGPTSPRRTANDVH